MTNTPGPTLYFFVSLRVVPAAPVSSQDKLTPLHLAAAEGHAEVVKALLATGASVHATEKVSEEERGGLDYRYGGPLHEGRGGNEGDPSQCKPPPNTQSPLKCYRAERLVMLTRK